MEYPAIAFNEDFHDEDLCNKKQDDNVVVEASNMVEKHESSSAFGSNTHCVEEDFDFANFPSFFNQAACNNDCTHDDNVLIVEATPVEKHDSSTFGGFVTTNPTADTEEVDEDHAEPPGSSSSWNTRGGRINWNSFSSNKKMRLLRNVSAIIVVLVAFICIVTVPVKKKKERSKLAGSSSLMNADWDTRHGIGNIDCIPLAPTVSPTRSH